jgi:excisionase family DNA binding protein
MLKSITPLTTAAAARRLEMSEQTVRNLVRRGKLKTIAVTASGLRLYDPSEVERFARELGR